MARHGIERDKAYWTDSCSCLTSKWLATSLLGCIQVCKSWLNNARKEWMTLYSYFAWSRRTVAHKRRNQIMCGLESNSSTFEAISWIIICMYSMTVHRQQATPLWKAKQTGQIIPELVSGRFETSSKRNGTRSAKLDLNGSPINIIIQWSLASAWKWILFSVQKCQPFQCAWVWGSARWVLANPTK